MNELLESELPWRTNHAPKSAPRWIPELPTTQLTGQRASPSVLNDTIFPEDLGNEMSLLELEELKPNPSVIGANTSLDAYIADVGILPVIHYIFEETHIRTMILLDEGSNTSLITMQVAKDLGLKGETKLTSICKAGE